jgi:nitrite reductase (NADH) large subunit
MKVVVIGNGMVGYKFCEKFRSKFSPSEASLVVFGEEFRPAYDRVHLSEYFSGKSPEELQMASKEWYAETGSLYIPVTRLVASTASIKP